MEVQLPAIAESAKLRPLSYNPHTNRFIYYAEVQSGTATIYPIEKLNEELLTLLVIERLNADLMDDVALLQRHSYSYKQLADEIRKGTKTGKLFYEADIAYLKFYLSQFPEDSFEK